MQRKEKRGRQCKDEMFEHVAVEKLLRLSGGGRNISIFQLGNNGFVGTGEVCRSSIRPEVAKLSSWLRFNVFMYVIRGLL